MTRELFDIRAALKGAERPHPQSPDEARFRPEHASGDRASAHERGISRRVADDTVVSNSTVRGHSERRTPQPRESLPGSYLARSQAGHGRGAPWRRCDVSVITDRPPPPGRVEPYRAYGAHSGRGAASGRRNHSPCAGGTNEVRGIEAKPR